MEQLTLMDIHFLSIVSEEYDIPLQTLHSRLKKLEEGKHYRKLGKGQGIMLTPKAVEKLVQGKNKIVKEVGNDKER